MDTEIVVLDSKDGAPEINLELAVCRARRTAFVARFIVLRESKRTRAHRLIELMAWDEYTTAEELYESFRNAFIQNGDNMEPVDRDLRRAFSHSQRSLRFFISEYSARSTGSFVEALEDYARSNELLFGADDQPKPGGWRLPHELRKAKKEPTKNASAKQGDAKRNQIVVAI